MPSETPETAYTLPMRPRLAAGAQVHPPSEEGAPWIIQSGHRYLRVGADMARLGQLLTGEDDLDELLARLDERWDEEALEQALRRFHDLRLLDDGRSRRPSSRRVTFAPPLTFQFSLMNPSRLLGSARPIVAFAGRPASLAVAAAVSIFGVVVLALESDGLVDAISRPVSGTTLLLFFAAVFVSTAIHELAHGAVLTHFGGRPQRLGVMLFYMIPAFFCDVSDGWRLSRNDQRVKVALAGIFAQYACAGLIALIALAVGSESEHQGWLLLAAASLYLAGTLNFIPFVKLDGYLALMAHLDISNLRSKAISDTRNFLGAVLFGADRERELPQLRWAVPYGLLCMAFPLYLVGFVALALWTQATAGIGFYGALVTLTIAIGVAVMIGVGFQRLVRASLDAGASMARVVLVSVATVTVIAWLGTQVHFAQSLRGQFTIHDGDPVLLVTDSSAADDVQPGQEVELRTRGPILQPQVGTAVVSAEIDGADVQDPGVVPFEMDIELPIAYRVFSLDEVDLPRDEVEGTTRVLLGERDVWSWVVDTFVSPVL